MNLDGIIEQWRKTKTSDSILQHELNFSNEKLHDSFNRFISIHSSEVEGLIGAGTNALNEHTVASLTKAYAELPFLKDTSRKKVLVGHDGSEISKFFVNVAASVLSACDLDVVFFAKNNPQPIALISSSVMESEISGGISIAMGGGKQRTCKINFFGPSGGLLGIEEVDSLKSNFLSSDILNIKTSAVIPEFLNESFCDKYIENLLGLKLDEAVTSIKVAFSGHGGSSDKIGNHIIQASDNDLNVEECVSRRDRAKVFNKEKEFNSIVKVARKSKSDLIFSVDPQASKVGVAVKYQRRYKYLNNDQISILYLEYILTKMKNEGELSKSSYIMISDESSSLLRSIANKFGVGVMLLSSFVDLPKQIEGSKGNPIFVYDKSCGFIADTNISLVGDALQVVMAISGVVSYFKTLGENTYDHLKSIYKEYGIHRSVVIEKKADEKGQRKILKSLSKLRIMDAQKVVEKEVLFFEEGGIKHISKIRMVMKDGSQVISKRSALSDGIITFVESVGKPGDSLIDIVSFEKIVEETIGGFGEEFSDKTWSWKSFWKYALFIGILTLIMVFVFLFVYKSSTNSTTKVFSVFTALYHSSNAWLWLSIWLWMISLKVIGAWAKKRMFDQLGVKVKMRHIFTSQVMGAVIAFVTPFAVGGDAIGYWYLRRKGVQRAPLIATLASATVWVEMKYALQTFFLFAIGFKFYLQIFDNPNPQAHAALIMFFVGFAWGVFSSGMILMLTISKRIQEFIVRNSVKFLEWFPWYHITDPGLLSSGVQRQFKLIRSGTKKIWTKPLFVFEMLVYDIVPMFFSPIALLYSTHGLINPNVASGTYWSQIVAADISGTANSMSFTPGGSGTWEWLSININETLFKNTDIAKTFGEPKMVASASDFLNKIIYQWPDLILSTIIIFLAILTVRRKPLPFLKGNKRFVFSGVILSLFFIGLMLLIFLI